MKIRAFLALSLVAVLLAPGCKKDESTTTLPSLTGLGMNTVTPFVREGTTLEFKADIESITATSTSTGTTVTQPDAIGLYWQVNGSGQRDTLTRNIKKSNPVYRYTADTLGTYNVYCYAYASGYYNASAYITFKAIDPLTVLTGLKTEGAVSFDGKIHRTVVIGEKAWLAENLYTEGGRLYGNAEVLESVFGRYYTWEEALTACPDGWHLPTDAEFDTLGLDARDLMAEATFDKEKMWEYWPGMDPTNELGFNAIPCGYMDLAQPSSELGYLEYAAWWTADEYDDLRATFRYIYEDDPLLETDKGSKTSLALNVRCVQD